MAGVILLLSDEVYSSLLKMLIEGVFKPGTLLNRRQIAQMLGVSVAPVLEAMLKLEADGFLETIPRKGTQVRVFTEEDIKGHLLVKEALECTAARLYSGNVLRSNFERLYPLAKKLDEQMASSNTIKYWQDDVNFHGELVALSGNRVLIKEYQRIALPNVYHHINKHLTNTHVLSHVLLIEQLCSDDQESAVKALQNHLRSGKGYYSNYFERTDNFTG